MTCASNADWQAQRSISRGSTSIAVQVCCFMHHAALPAEQGLQLFVHCKQAQLCRLEQPCRDRNCAEATQSEGVHPQLCPALPQPEDSVQSGSFVQHTRALGNKPAAGTLLPPHPVSMPPVCLLHTT